MALYIVGAGGFGRETLDAAISCGRRAVAFADDRLAGDTVAGLPVMRPEDVPHSPGDSVVVAVADPVQRTSLVERMTAGGIAWDVIVHPSAGLGSRTVTGDGTIVLAHSWISCDVVLGEHSHVNYGATIGHDTHLGRFCTVLPGATIGGNVTVGEMTVIGSGAVVLQGLTIGPGAIVGAGAVVTRDVPDGQTVVGVPARQRH